MTTTATTSRLGDAARTMDLRRWTALALYLLLGFLLVQVLFESWVQVLFATRGVDATGATTIVDMPAWPKALKNLAYVALVVVAASHVVLTRGYRRFGTAADLAFVVLGVTLVVAGLAGGSSPQLTGEGIYVYLRGAVVLYAVRALDPPWERFKPILWVVGAVIVLNALVAAALAFSGAAGYSLLGWVDMSWASLNRAQALQEHPNHLGHIVGLMVLGLMAWFSTRPSVGRRWWLVFVLLALSLALTQSRESLVGVLGGIAIIGLLYRRRLRTLAAGVGVILILTGVVWTAQPGTWAHLIARLRGVGSAIEVPSGSEQGVTCDPIDEDCTAEGLPKREIRVLYIQQGFRLWLNRPLLGYGVGQFGGFVASNHDPQWYLDPRFGPHGFDLHGFTVVGVDSFWLHLVVETGTLGTVAYLTWYALLAAPGVRAARRNRRARRLARLSPGADPDHETQLHFTMLWAPAALAFGVVVAGLSPALEDHLFPPLLFGIVGLSWIVARRGDRSTEAGAADGLAATAAPFDA